MGMLGRYQVDNASTAQAAMEVFQEAGVVVDEAAKRRGLAETRWEGRLERVARRPDIFLDGAHNPASAAQLAAALRELKPSYQRLVLIIGILGDKDHVGILSHLLPLADRVIVTKPNYSRAMDVEALASSVRQQHGSVETTETVAAAIALARHQAAPDDLILITGSLYVVGDARALFQGPDRDAPALTGLKG